MKVLDEVEELWQEIKICEKKIETEVKPVYLEAISKYVGEDATDEDIDIKYNDVFPIVQQKLPYLFFKNPKAFVKPRRKHVFIQKRNPITGVKEKTRVSGPKLAKTTEAVVNYSMHESGFEEEMDKISLDLALAPYAYLWQSYTGEFGIREDETMYVKSESIFQKRIRPDLFLYDTEGTCEEEWRWIGRKVRVRLRDILEDPRYSEKAKKDLKGGVGYGETVKNQGTDTRPITYDTFLSSDYKESVNSKRVWLYEIWKKPSLKDKLKGKKGKVYVLCQDTKEPLYEKEWVVKQEGFPGEMFRINPLNDTALGIPDPKTYITLAKEKELEANLILKHLKESTAVKVVLNGAKFDEEDIQKFMDGENKYIVSNQPLQVGDVTPIQTGSVPSAAFQVAQNTDMQLQKQSAITAQRLGIDTPGEKTATEIEVRNQANLSRPTVHQKLIARSLKKLARKRIQLIKQFFKKQDMVPILGTFDFEWSDEYTNEDITDEVDVEIDIQSMIPDNPAVEMRNLLDLLSLMTQAYTNPDIRDKIENKEGRIFNFTPIIEKLLLRMKIRDEEVFRPVRPEEGEGATPNATLLDAQQETLQAVLTQQVDPPQPGENHDVHLQIHEIVLAMLEQLGIQSPVLEQHIEQTKILRLQEEEQSGAKKEGTPLKTPRFDTVPTRASESARAQDTTSQAKVQAI